MARRNQTLPEDIKGFPSEWKFYWNNFFENEAKSRTISVRALMVGLPLAMWLGWYLGKTGAEFTIRKGLIDALFFLHLHKQISLHFHLFFL